MVGADVPGGPPPARGVRQPSRAWAWGAGGRVGRAPLPMSRSSCVRANQRGRPVRTPRAEGGAGTSRAGPWVGGRVAGPWVGCWSRAAPSPAATSAALPCRRGAGDVGFHFGTVPPGRYAARRRAKYPRRPRRGTSKRARRRARPRQARPSRMAEGLGDARFHVGAVPPGRYAVRRRAKYPRRPRHGTSKRARHRARPRQARPSRVAEGVGDARFHVGAVPPGRYAARRRAKYPRRPRRGTSTQARRRARPRQARPSRVAEGLGDARFHIGTVLK